VSPFAYEFIRRLLKERSGLALAPDKRYLVESRLLPLARRLGIGDIDALVQRLKGPDAETLIVRVVEAMMTNESFFFRDRLPFEYFRQMIMPTLLGKREKRQVIRIWSAAAATGQEPYSLAMTLCEMGSQLADRRVEILGTDLSSEVLDKAKSGLYSQFEVQRGLPIQILLKYFTRVGDMWQIAPRIRSMVIFRQLNLLNDFTHLGFFDVVFCRNVLIYFDTNTKVAVLDRLARVMKPDGYLVLGAAETVLGFTEAFRPIRDRPGLYMPTRSAPGQRRWEKVQAALAAEP
jgi:chemotaxis protein methyltransferase CheR